MKKIGAVAFALLAVVAGARAQSTNAPGRHGGAAHKISAADATNYFNQSVIVTAKVAQVSIRPSIVFINLDKPYPTSPLALVIFPKFTNGFSNLPALKGKTVEIQGLVTNYRGRPEIVLEKTNQLLVLDSKTN